MRHLFVKAILCLFLIGCSQQPESTEESGPMGTPASGLAPEEMLQLGDLQPLGTVLTPLTRERAVTVLVDLWIDRIPKNIEIITRTPDGTISSELGEQILQNRRVHTFTIDSGNPIPGDLVFYRSIEGDPDEGL